MTAPRLGPVLAATIVTQDLDHSIGVYREHLGLSSGETSTLNALECAELAWPTLENSRFTWLSNALGEPWLRLVEHKDAQARQPFTHYGWLALEVAVQDVDALGDSLLDSPFDIIGAPADLAMSDAIRAMQVIGPSGEVLYLTQVKRPLPPFELPRARCPVDRLFIAVLTCPNRDCALDHYAELSGNDGLKFDTQITVISAARSLPENHPHPVATLQLAENTLIELDQLADLQPAPYGGDDIPTGIAQIDFLHEDIMPGLHFGAAGERYYITPDRKDGPYDPLKHAT